MKFDTLDDAIGAINDPPNGNGASSYTQSSCWARKFSLKTQAGMIGINVGNSAPVASLPFGGSKNSIYPDIKAQGSEVVRFFIERKIITQRFWPDS